MHLVSPLLRHHVLMSLQNHCRSVFMSGSGGLAHHDIPDLIGLYCYIMAVGPVHKKTFHLVKMVSGEALCYLCRNIATSVFGSRSAIFMIDLCYFVLVVNKGMLKMKTRVADFFSFAFCLEFLYAAPFSYGILLLAYPAPLYFLANAAQFYFRSSSIPPVCDKCSKQFAAQARIRHQPDKLIHCPAATLPVIESSHLKHSPECAHVCP